MNRHLPIEIRKACLILGVDARVLNMTTVENAWNEVKLSMHDDAVDDDQEALEIHANAKETLIAWLKQPR
jgi:hypothetical protein